MDLFEAIQTRQSTRAFTKKSVPQDCIYKILDLARWSPSGVNAQPWKVVVVTGDIKQKIGQAIIQARESDTPENPDYSYYSKDWFEPYKSRRKACGMALYASQGITLTDKELRKAAWYRNYHFFDAPVGLLFFVDERLSVGSWIDIGMFIQTLMLAARGLKLATCPQAALAEYPDIVRQFVKLDKQYKLICGMALGYPEASAAINQYRTEREPVDYFTDFIGF